MFSGCWIKEKFVSVRWLSWNVERDLEHLTVTHGGYEFGEPDLGMLNRLNFKIILIEASK